MLWNTRDTKIIHAIHLPGAYQELPNFPVVFVFQCLYSLQRLPWSLSAGNESAWDAGDPVSIPGLGRSCGEGIGYPLQYFWASLVVHQVKKICLQCGRPGFDPWVDKIPWRKAWQPIPVFLPGESSWTEVYVIVKALMVHLFSNRVLHTPDLILSSTPN